MSVTRLSRSQGEEPMEQFMVYVDCGESMWLHDEDMPGVSHQIVVMLGPFDSAAEAERVSVGVMAGEIDVRTIRLPEKAQVFQLYPVAVGSGVTR